MAIIIFQIKGGFINVKAIFSELTKEMVLSPGATEDQLRDFIFCFPVSLPRDFITFLEFSNGAEGIIGSSYLVIWGTEELSSYNECYSVKTFAPGLIIFGSDGGGEAYGFNTNTTPYQIVGIPFICLDWKDAVFIANSFVEFLKFLSSGQDYID